VNDPYLFNYCLEKGTREFIETGSIFKFFLPVADLQHTCITATPKVLLRYLTRGVFREGFWGSNPLLFEKSSSIC